jgi:hypothetical protein
MGCLPLAAKLRLKLLLLFSFVKARANHGFLLSDGKAGKQNVGFV